MELTQEQQSALLRYEELKVMVKEAESEMEKIKPVVIAAVPEGTKVNAKDGFFELKRRDNWTFGDDIQAKESDLKALKEAAIAKGEATSKPTFYVEYRKAKKVAAGELED